MNWGPSGNTKSYSQCAQLRDEWERADAAYTMAQGLHSAEELEAGFAAVGEFVEWHKPWLSTGSLTNLIMGAYCSRFSSQLI